MKPDPMPLWKALFYTFLGVLRSTAFPMHVFRAYVAGSFGMLAMVSLLVSSGWGALFYFIASIAIVVSVFWEHYATKESETPRV